MINQEESRLFQLKLLQQKRISALKKQIDDLEQEIQFLHQTMNRMDDL